MLLVVLVLQLSCSSCFSCSCATASFEPKNIKHSFFLDGSAGVVIIMVEVEYRV